MSINSSRKAIQKSITVYEKILSEVSEELFTRTPAEGVWSYAEVFAHIFTSNIGCCKAIESCAKGAAVENNQSLPFSIRLVLLFKRLPPGKKYMVPEKIAKDVRKISRKEAEDIIHQCKEQLETVFPMINFASSNQKIKHPRLGLFNARQWYSFIHLHILHHQRQLYRIMAMHNS
jgi:hypothetical protein